MFRFADLAPSEILWGKRCSKGLCGSGWTAGRSVRGSNWATEVGRLTLNVDRIVSSAGATTMSRKTMSRAAVMHLFLFSLDYECDKTICFDLLMVVDCNQRLGAKISPFPQSCSLPGHFVKAIETKLRRTYYEVLLVTC